MELLIGIAIFFAIVLLLEGIFLAVRAARNPEAKRVRKELKALSVTRVGGAQDITKRRPLSQVPWLNNLLSRFPVMRQLDVLLQQADSPTPLGVFVILSFILLILGWFIGSLFARSNLVGLVVGLILAAAPFLYILIKRNQRMAKFESQLPDALDLVARSLRAGHAFSGGLQMVGQEFADPIGPEFAKTFAEVNFGVSITDALKNLTQRVHCPDLKFFAISVIIQRESGGNLAEILESIARLIRERFKLHGRIRTLAAEGKLSAIILIALPFFVVLVLSFMNPDYIKILGSDSLGKTLVLLSVIGMILGVLVMKKIVAIRV
jgi:tight adherence protein B